MAEIVLKTREDDLLDRLEQCLRFIEGIAVCCPNPEVATRFVAQIRYKEEK
jgi:hypothetical protein